MTAQWGSPPPRREAHFERRTKIWVAVLGSPVLAGLISLLVVWAPWKHDTPKQNPTGPGIEVPNGPNIPANQSQSVFVNPTSGAGGIQVKVSGEGFPPKSHVVFVFHTEQFGEVTTDSAGKFSNVAAKIPKSFSMFAPQQFSISAVSGALSASTPFELTG